MTHPAEKVTRYSSPAVILPGASVCRREGHDWIEPDADDTVCRRCAMRRTRATPPTVK